MSDRRYSTPVNNVTNNDNDKNSNGNRRPSTIQFNTDDKNNRSSKSRIKIVNSLTGTRKSKRGTITEFSEVYSQGTKDEMDDYISTPDNKVQTYKPNKVVSISVPPLSDNGKDNGKDNSSNDLKKGKSKNLLVDEEEYPEKVYNEEGLRRRYNADAYFTDIDSSDDEGDGDRMKRGTWRSIAQIFTCCFPEKCVPGRTRDQKQAWREKIAINCLIYIFSAIILFIFGVLPLLICPNDDIYTFRDINAQRNAAWIVVHGDILDMDGYFDKHPGGLDPLRDYLGQDASLFFKRPELSEVDPICLNEMSNFLANNTMQRCESQSVLGDNINFDFRHCHSVTTEDEVVSDLKVGELAFSYPDLEEPDAGQWVIIFDRVYNVTEYISNDQDYLNENLDAIIKNKLKEDATEVYREVYPRNETLGCMEQLFFGGVLDVRFSLECTILNTIILISVIIIIIIMAIKFLTSIITIGNKGYRERKKFVIINIPCYTEDRESLSKTINSVTSMDYSDKHKLLFIVCDGNLRGQGQKRTTPETVLAILGQSFNNETRTYTYASLGKGAKRQNVVRVYSGWYKYQNGKEEVHEVPYIVVVKIGFAHEATEKPGNRGKRDSQLILFNFLSKMFYLNQGLKTKSVRLNKLDEELVKRFTELERDVNDYQFMLTVDSDTEMAKDALKIMIAHMNNKSVLALCGETKVSDPNSTFITSIQVFEYYLNHNFHKAAESAFGVVSCLPGCNSLYRLKFKESHRDIPGLVDKRVLKDYSSNDVSTLHRRNLLELGEDRYLTSLLLKYFSHKKLIYVPQAKCWTSPPRTLIELLKQRKRWINSTIANMLELLTYRELRGICCFSLRFIIMMDLISAFTLPASLIYLGYLLYLFFTESSTLSLLIVITLGIVYATQFLIFVFKRDYGYLFYMLLYLVSVPLWWFIMPIYSYAKLDNFNWANREAAKIKLKSNNNPNSNNYNDSITGREHV